MVQSTPSPSALHDASRSFPRGSRRRRPADEGMIVSTQPSPPRVKKKKKPQKKCTFPDGCQNNAKSRGLCKRHGGGMRCRVESCTTSARPGGLCIAHGGGLCKVMDCSTGARSAGLCLMHQRIQEIRQRHGTTGSSSSRPTLTFKPTPNSSSSTSSRRVSDVGGGGPPTHKSKKRTSSIHTTRHDDLQLTTSETLSPLPQLNTGRQLSDHFRSKHHNHRQYHPYHHPGGCQPPPYDPSSTSSSSCSVGQRKDHPPGWLIGEPQPPPPPDSASSFPVSPVSLGPEFSSFISPPYYPPPPPSYPLAMDHHPSSKYNTLSYGLPPLHASSGSSHPSPFSNFPLYGPTPPLPSSNTHSQQQQQCPHSPYPSSSNHFSMLLGHLSARVGETPLNRPRRGDSFSEFTTTPADLSVSIPSSMGNSQHWTGSGQRFRSASMVVSPKYLRAHVHSESSSSINSSMSSSGNMVLHNIDFSIQDVNSDLVHHPLLHQPTTITSSFPLPAIDSSSNREVIV